MPPRYTVKQVFRILKKDGWIHVRTRGSHHQFEHPVKPGKVTVPGKSGDLIAPGTYNQILKQAGLK
ncbi:type II toxin-antitoxin system HicA family toxin [bacterium]|nr:type II toxin-antitoxin system HicA family toxin [bacterium]